MPQVEISSCQQAKHAMDISLKDASLGESPLEYIMDVRFGERNIS